MTTDLRQEIIIVDDDICRAIDILNKNWHFIDYTGIEGRIIIHTDSVEMLRKNNISYEIVRTIAAPEKSLLECIHDVQSAFRNFFEVTGLERLVINVVKQLTKLILYLNKRLGK